MSSGWVVECIVGSEQLLAGGNVAKKFCDKCEDVIAWNVPRERFFMSSFLDGPRLREAERKAERETRNWKASEGEGETKERKFEFPVGMTTVPRD